MMFLMKEMLLIIRIIIKIVILKVLEVKDRITHKEANVETTMMEVVEGINVNYVESLVT